MLRSTLHHAFSIGDAKIIQTRIGCRILTMGLGALHTYAAVKSQSMNADGISYLDIGDAYFRADWATAVNTVWSPLYSWILGFVNFIFKPPMVWEFPTVHIVNFLIFLAALVSFEFMWGNIRITPTESDTITIPEAHWWSLGYLLFIWTSLSLIEIWAVTPDMLMAVFVFLAAGYVAKLRAGDENLSIFLRLGLVLGLGYLSKTFMFSTALVFLVVTWLVQQRTWDSVKRALTAAVVFLVISLPYVTIISNAKGKLTIGESGTVTYVRHVLGIPYPHWQGSPEQHILPTHPSRVIHQSPAVYEFGEPIGGTYPIALDPSYWYEGITAQMTSSNLMGSLLASGIHYLELFFQKQGVLVACILILYGMRPRRTGTLPEIARRWALVIPAVISFGLYALVLVEDRYVGVFVLLFWSDILANIRLPDLPDSNMWIKIVSLVAASGLLVNIILFNLDGFTRLNPSVSSSFKEASAPAARPLAVAEALHELGIQQGDKVGVIGYAYDSFWARLARVKIVAEMLEADATDFWQGNEALQQSVLQAFVSSGAKAVIAEYVPDTTQLQDWHRVGNSNYYIYKFGK